MDSKICLPIFSFFWSYWVLSSFLEIFCHIYGSSVNYNFLTFPRLKYGLHSDTNDKESTCQCRRHKRHNFNAWVGKIPWKKAWQPIPVVLSGEFPWTEEPGGLQSIVPQRLLKWLSLHTCYLNITRYLSRFFFLNL